MTSRAFFSFFASIALGVALFSIAGSDGVQAADDPAKSIQQALKKRGFYFGEASGVIDEQTKSALKRFQIHEGLSVTGEIDTPTVEALQNEPASASHPPTAAPSLQKNAAKVVQSDHEFLERIDTATQQDASPPPELGSATHNSDVPRSEGAVSPRTHSAAERIAPAEISPSPEKLSPTDARLFVDNYLQAAHSPTPDNEVNLYADEVDYFDSGKVSREFIRKDQARYYRRWPSRDFKLLGTPEVQRASNDRVTVRFRIHYSLHGEKEYAAGQTENELRLQKTGSGLKIIGIRERKTPD